MYKYIHVLFACVEHNLCVFIFCWIKHTTVLLQQLCNVALGIVLYVIQLTRSGM